MSVCASSIWLQFSSVLLSVLLSCQCYLVEWQLFAAALRIGSASSFPADTVKVFHGYCLTWYVCLVLGISWWALSVKSYSFVIQVGLSNVFGILRIARLPVRLLIHDDCEQRA